MFMLIPSNSSPLNLVLVQIHRAEIIVLGGYEPGCKLHPDHAVRVVVKTTLLRFRLRSGQYNKVFSKAGAGQL